MKTILPFETNIPVNSLVHLAYPLGIIYGNCTRNQADIYTIMNHLQLMWYHEDNPPGYELVFYIPFFPRRKCFKRKTLNVKNEKDDVIIKTIINYINEGYYIYLITDEYYLTNSLKYNTQHNPHDLLIYGYNDQEMIFNIAGYDRKSRYGVRTCDFKELSFDKSCPIECLKLKKTFKQSLKKSIIVNELKNYINPLKYTYIESKKQSRRDFGVNAIKLLKTYIINMYFMGQKLNIIPFNIYLERIGILYILAIYLRLDDNLIFEISELKKSVRIMKNMAIKYNLTDNKTILEHMIVKLNDCINKEICIIQSFLKRL